MLWLDCPRCGRRPLDEFTFGGERRPTPDSITDPDERDFDEVWIFENPDGVTTERWFHAAGCRRWLTVRRDTSDRRRGRGQLMGDARRPALRDDAAQPGPVRGRGDRATPRGGRRGRWLAASSS